MSNILNGTQKVKPSFNQEMDLHALLNKKVQLPPIAGLTNAMPAVHFLIPQEAAAPPPEQEIQMQMPTEMPHPLIEGGISQGTGEDINGLDMSRSAPYTLLDDLSIFKVVATYYGIGFHGKIPWSFWQTYKRVTGSTRSNSSLYHHWNGAMKKKYEAFISKGRLSECIMWLETAVNAEQTSSMMPPPPQQPSVPHAGVPLCHNRSQPSMPLMMPSQSQNQPLSLIRTASCLNESDLPFHNLQ